MTVHVDPFVCVSVRSCYGDDTRVRLFVCNGHAYYHGSEWLKALVVAELPKHTKRVLAIGMNGCILAPSSNLVFTQLRHVEVSIEKAIYVST